MTAQTVVVGAGTAGLAVAATLGRAGVPYALLERGGAVGPAWRGRYDSLRLHTARWLSGLPGAPIPRRYGLWVSRDDLVAYLQDYARRFEIAPEYGVEVTRIDRVADGWELTTSAGPRRARTVVLATGFTHTPHIPDWPGRDTFPGPLGHSVDYREPSPYRDRRVLVVGAGNSAAEIAVELTGVGAEVLLSVRNPPNIVRRDTLGVPSQLIGLTLERLPGIVLDPLMSVLRRVTVPDLRGYGLPPPEDGFSQFVRSKTVPILDHGFVAAVRRGRIAVVPEITAIDGGDVRLVDGTVVRPDAIVAATWYRPGLEDVVGHLGVLDGAGVPLAGGARTLPEAPGLYFVGIGVNLSGLIRHLAAEARSVSGAIAADVAG